jgi:DNA-binding MarR family transcriptional regulator
MNRRAPRIDHAAHHGDDVRAVMDDLRRIVRGLRLTARDAERDAGISGAQLFVLQALAAGKASSLNDLAERTCTDQSSVSVVVRRLVDKGLVARKASEQDARRVELSLTPAGRRLAKRCPEPTQARLLTALERLSSGDLLSLRGTLDVLVRGMGLRDEVAPMFFDDEGATAPKRAARR